MMLDRIKGFEKVIVTGPQRSGTTIAARIISHDFGLRYVDEYEFSVNNDMLVRELLRSPEPLVIHGPALSYLIHTLPLEETIVVFMLRSIRDIEASQKRINWLGETEEMECYARRPEFGGMFSVLKDPIAVICYKCWWYYQESVIPHSMMLKYEHLSKHPLWIEKKDRKNFHARQWRHE